MSDGAGIYMANGTVTLDGTTITGNRVYRNNSPTYNGNGGGILQLPLAAADDGLFDVTLIKPVHWWHVVFRLMKLFNGKIYEIGHVQHLQGSRIRVESSPETPVEVDGELLGHTPLNFNILHRAVRVIVNKDFLE